MRIAHIDPFSGASGDMLLGAVVDAGIDLKDMVRVLHGLRLEGWELTAEPVTRAGIGGTLVRVEVEDTGVVRTWSNVRDLLAGADLPGAVRDRALATFHRLAVAEAHVHRQPVERIHFHEVGAVDAIVDIVGVCAGLAMLGCDRVTVGPVAQGIGTVRSAHGLLPVPAPAVLELLKGAPTYSTGVPAELCTPTGAALLAEWADDWGELPRIAIDTVGYGAGRRELEHPNLVRLVLGAVADRVHGPSPTPPLVMLETTVDDLQGELVPPVLDALRAAGARDAWARSVLMKKGRPGLEIACLAPTELADDLARVLFTETTTLGVRSWAVDRRTLAREAVRVEVAGHPVRLKVARLHGEVVNVAPEFDDAAAVAKATGLPLKEVFARARAAWPPPAGRPGPSGRSA